MAQNESEVHMVENGYDPENEQNKNQENKKLKQEVGVLSMERLFEDQEVPSWRKQLTRRAFAVSFVLSILFTFIIMKLNLTTGIIPALNVPAGLFGFFFIKTWTKLLHNSGLLKQPFTRQENTVIQTCVVASSGIAFSGMPSFRASIIS
ncbi:probable metal-nicotianamine transporter YSL5 [Juglans microcarpa x Juglans regia]|uniref:probable metal-nicotianamine transporter YSL5 n=1 Tax=Juglans microcarpa x Juglans regia TaxID=2249226 RepID=UPI001B7EFEA8|nr:probable metal-nicotianamine transporter YSL5 [Juglans microcarpa x Juglans regia]